MNAPAFEALAGTPNWFAARRGLLTASRMRDAMAVLKNGSPAAARTNLMRDLLAERLTGIAVPHFVTADMQWGIDNQDGARHEYQVLTGEIVGPEGFVLHPDIEFFGATPDGFVGEDGLLEVKCPRSATHLSWILDGVVPEDHRPQMLAQLACTRRKWCDFVSYDPRNPHKPLFVRRFAPEQAEIERIEEVAREFLAELDALFEKISTVEVMA